MQPILGNIVWDLVVDGGPIMWPILGCLFVASMVVLERALWWNAVRRSSEPDRHSEVYDAIVQGRFQEAIHASSGSRDPVLTVVREGLENAHSSLLGAMQLRATGILDEAERRLWALSTLITLAPLLGLLGTVVGIMDSFQFVGNEELAATKVSGGIAEALIATAGGLSVAIVSLLPYNFFTRSQSRLRSKLERAINQVELLVESAKDRGDDLGEFSRRRAIEFAEADSRTRVDAETLEV